MDGANTALQFWYRSHVHPAALQLLVSSNWGAVSDPLELCIISFEENKEGTHSSQSATSLHRNRTVDARAAKDFVASSSLVCTLLVFPGGVLTTVAARARLCLRLRSML